jgi:hypothetical protein
VAVVFTLSQTKQIINIHNQNNIKNTVQTIHNTVNTSIHITKTPIHYKTHTNTYPHITKQVKTITVQVKTQYMRYPNESHNIIKYPQYKVTLMYKALLSPRPSP